MAFIKICRIITHISLTSYPDYTGTTLVPPADRRPPTCPDKHHLIKHTCTRASPNNNMLFVVRCSEERPRLYYFSKQIFSRHLRIDEGYLSCSDKKYSKNIFHFFALVTRQSAALSSVAQHGTLRKFGGRWETKLNCVSTRFPLPTLLCAG